MTTVGLVVPEYRTEHSTGGVASVADFLLQSFDPEWDVRIVSVRMSRSAPESRAVLQPRSWFARLRPRADGDVTYVGAHLAESEVARFLPRAAVRSALGDVDVVVVVSGSPAFANVVRGVHAPVLLQVATFVDAERASTLAKARGPRRLMLRAATRALSRLDVLGVRLPDLVAVENEWMHRRCTALGARHVELCPPGVDTDLFVPGGRAVDGSGDLVSVARLGDPRKDFDTLVRAYAHARGLGLRRRLVIAGRGDLPREVVDLIDELGIGEHIEVRRDLSAAALVRLLQDSSLFVMSSTEEGLGLTLVEAMGCGLPVLSTATEGAKAVVGDSSAGELVPIASPVDLGRALAKWDGIRGEAYAARSHAARTRAEQEFSVHVTGARFRRLVTRTCEAAAGSDPAAPGS